MDNVLTWTMTIFLLFSEIVIFMINWFYHSYAYRPNWMTLSPIYYYYWYGVQVMVRCKNCQKLCICCLFVVHKIKSEKYVSWNIYPRENFILIARGSMSAGLKVKDWQKETIFNNFRPRLRPRLFCLQKINNS